MAVDAPKAAHFTASIHGKQFLQHDPVGLDYRWAVANRLCSEGIHDMMRLTDSHRQTIAAVLAEFNVSLGKHGIRIDLGPIAGKHSLSGVPSNWAISK